MPSFLDATYLPLDKIKAMLLPRETKVEHLQSLFEGREAIYIEKGALYVKVNNIREGPRLYISAEVEDIPTTGFSTGIYREIYSKIGSPGRWTIGTSDLRYSDHIWHGGYGGWSLFFAPRIVEGILNLALQFPDKLDSVQRYERVLDYLKDHNAYEPTQRLLKVR